MAGVSQRFPWLANLVDNPQSYKSDYSSAWQSYFLCFRYIAGAVDLGIQQIQTAKMLVRYPDTAYEAHGNYGVNINSLYL